jgi:hypothetical protein
MTSKTIITVGEFGGAIGQGAGAVKTFSEQSPPLLQSLEAYAGPFGTTPVRAIA